jgi:hypothetical protein
MGTEHTSTEHFAAVAANFSMGRVFPDIVGILIDDVPEALSVVLATDVVGTKEGSI